MAQKLMKPATHPIVTICIANYNGINLIDTCVKSILMQDCDFPVEIIIHDDASTDGSVDYIRTHYPDITMIESTDNVGYCISNNRMVDKANGKYILLLNNDAELFPDALQTLFETASSLREPAILGLPQYDAGTEQLIDIGSQFDLFLNPIPNLDPLQTETGMIIGACFWLPRTLWNDLGGFPEWFGSLAEDMYLCCVAKLYGYKVLALAKSGFKHRVGHSLGGGKIVNDQLSTKATRRALSERNKNYVMYLAYPAPFLQLVLPLHIILLIIEGGTLALIKRDKNIFIKIYLSSIKALWIQRDLLFRGRKLIQRKKNITYRIFFSSFQLMPYKLQMLYKYGIPKIL